MEVAARRRVHRARHLTRQDDTTALRLYLRIWIRDSGKQRLRIWMLGSLEQGFARRGFDNPAQIHDRNLVAHLANNRKVVSNEEVRQAELDLQIEQEPKDLGLD